MCVCVYMNNGPNGPPPQVSDCIRLCDTDTRRELWGEGKETTSSYISVVYISLSEYIFIYLFIHEYTYIYMSRRRRRRTS